MDGFKCTRSVLFSSPMLILNILPRSGSFPSNVMFVVPEGCLEAVIFIALNQYNYDIPFRPNPHAKLPDLVVGCCQGL